MELGSFFPVRLVGTRRAFALLVLGFIWTTFAWLGLAAPPAFRAMFLGLSATYVIAFVGIGAGYFWGRWYANGLGWSGAWSLLALLQVDDPRPVLVWAGMHIAVLLLLAGQHMVEAYEGRKDWRERLGVDDENVRRIGVVITTVASLLPMLVGQLLGRPSGLEVLTLGAAGAGLFLLVRMRTAGLFVLAGAGAMALTFGGSVSLAVGPDVVVVPMLAPVAGVGLILPLVLFAPAILRFLRRPA